MPEIVTPRLRRLVAPNPGPMTYRGTNTWLLDTGDGLTVIDPGPDNAGHVAVIAALCGGALRRILLTHTHSDHLGGARALQDATGAPVFSWGKPWKTGFTPDAALSDGDVVAGVMALHTPGHASDHLCFAWDDGSLFSGDHVMSWNTSIVSPPDGDMAAYMASLRRLLARDDRVFYCGHGPVLQAPQALMRAMLGHRIARESAILSVLADGAVTAPAIVERLYAEVDSRLKPAAERTVLAHLIKLEGEGRAAQTDGAWTAAGWGT